MPYEPDPPTNHKKRPEHEPWQHSSGPTSDAGKAISSQNARTHGCTSTQLVLPDEDPAEWEALQAAWLRDYSPDCDTFRDLVLTAATAQWFLRRNDKRLHETEQFLFTEGGPSATFWLENQHRLYERILRYRTAAERAFLRARAAVEQHRRSRFLEQKESTRQQERQGSPVPTGDESETTAVESEGFLAHSASNGLSAPYTTKRPVPRSIAEIHALVQHFRIWKQDGVTRTTRSPSNAEMVRVAQFKKPPVLIRRLFQFEHGFAPEYGWLQNTRENYGRTDNLYFLDFSRNEFEALSAMEDPDLRALPLDSTSIVTTRNGAALFDIIMKPEEQP